MWVRKLKGLRGAVEKGTCPYAGVRRVALTSSEMPSNTKIDGVFLGKTEAEAVRQLVWWWLENYRSQAIRCISV